MNPTYSLILQEAYADDVETAIDWYENQSPGLDLVDESDQLVYLIALIHQRRSQAFIRKRLRKKQ